jgi:hypothetical protein
MYNDFWSSKKQDDDYIQETLFADEGYMKNLQSSKSSKILPALISQPERVKLVLTNDLLDKIKYICSQFPDKEWSGVLFYQTEGNIMDINNFVIKAVNLYPLDLGTSGFTEFEYNDEYNKYIVRNPDMLSYNQGIIHSHNMMETFFSGTDTNTLAENAHLFSGMLSLIVNNAGKYNAKLAVYKVSVITESISFKDCDYSSKITAKEYEKQYIDVYDCNITYQIANVDKEIKESVKNLISNPELQHINRKKAGIVNTIPTLPKIPATVNKPKEKRDDWEKDKRWNMQDEKDYNTYTDEFTDIDEQMYMEFLGRIITCNPLWISTHNYDNFMEFVMDMMAVTKNSDQTNLKYSKDVYIEAVDDILNTILGNCNIEEVVDMIFYLHLEIEGILSEDIDFKLPPFWRRMFEKIKVTLEYFLNDYRD